MKIFYINNPAAANGKGAKYFSLIKNEFTEKNIFVDSVQTEYAGEGTEIIKNLEFADYDGIAVSGGDGTLFEVINGYYKNNSAKRVPIGVIPIGRGNAFARDIDLTPDSWKESIDVIAAGKTKFADLGLCSAKNSQFYFCNILGFGFVTDVAQTAFNLRVFGHLSYILGVLYRTISLKPYMLKIEVDGVKYERENVFTEISNTRYTGKDFLMAPAAKFNDGLLDITLLNKLSRIRLLQALPKIFTGDHVKMKEVETFQARYIKIETMPDKMLTPDGQLIESTPIIIECKASAIEVFVR